MGLLLMWNVETMYFKEKKNTSLKSNTETYHWKLTSLSSTHIIAHASVSISNENDYDFKNSLVKLP